MLIACTLKEWARIADHTEKDFDKFGYICANINAMLFVLVASEPEEPNPETFVMASQIPEPDCTLIMQAAKELGIAPNQPGPRTTVTE